MTRGRAVLLMTGAVAAVVVAVLGVPALASPVSPPALGSVVVVSPSEDPSTPRRATGTPTTPGVSPTSTSSRRPASGGEASPLPLPPAGERDGTDRED